KLISAPTHLNELLMTLSLRHISIAIYATALWLFLLFRIHKTTLPKNSFKNYSQIEKLSKCTQEKSPSAEETFIASPNNNQQFDNYLKIQYSLWKIRASPALIFYDFF